jgi:hypothetical protein
MDDAEAFFNAVQAVAGESHVVGGPMSPEAWGAIGLIGAAVATGLFGLAVAAVSNRRTKRIEDQLKPNGGQSMHDLLHHVARQVNLIEQNQATMAGDMRDARRRLEDHIEESAEWKAHLAKRGLAPPAA